jgi:glutamate formiminotransferase/glutamate formiminotransferase/formiminotetrahydrofolate cyclodeaminase
MTPPTLLAVPNVSEGRNDADIAALTAAISGPSADPSGVTLLDVHSDADHHRSVFTIAGVAGELADALLRMAHEAVSRVDVMAAVAGGPPDGANQQPGQHPHVGAIDVVPIVYLDPEARGAACAEALVVADRIAEELRVPVFLYGELTVGPDGQARTRAQLRKGGVSGLAARMATSAGRLVPDFGPHRLHPTAGATLVAARPSSPSTSSSLPARACRKHARSLLSSASTMAADCPAYAPSASSWAVAWRRSR